MIFEIVSKRNRIDNVMIAPIAPLTIPQISPTTSLQMLLTKSARFNKYIACVAPFIFFDAIDINGVISAAAMDMPIVSNVIPIMMNINNMIKANGIETDCTNDSAIKLIATDSINVRRIIFNIQPYALFFIGAFSVGFFFNVILNI